MATSDDPELLILDEDKAAEVSTTSGEDINFKSFEEGNTVVYEKEVVAFYRSTTGCNDDRDRQYAQQAANSFAEGKKQSTGYELVSHGYRRFTARRQFWREPWPSRKRRCT